jgi:hypothetical protein
VTPANGWSGYVLEAVDRCGCVVASIVDDVAITGKRAASRFLKEHADLTVRRVPSSEHQGISVCTCSRDVASAAPAPIAPSPQAETAAARYQAFLEAKVCTAQARGFEVSPDEVSPHVKPHVRAIVPWLVRLGRAACFSSFGLQKTTTQLEAVRLTLERTGGRALIVCPLGVRREFLRDAVETLRWPSAPHWIRSTSEAQERGINLTNWESVREGKIDPRAFQVASFDEADALRSFGSKTFSEVVVTGGWNEIPFRYVASATPDPNDYLELLGYAQFLGVMDIGQAKTRFFKRDSEHADRLTLLRVLRPGRVCAVHVKDRVVDSGMTGLGFQVVHPFHAEAIAHFGRHGFAFLGMKTVVTDVVRENAQTYRLGYTEQCKDGSRMGAGLPEYILLFRKPQTDRSRGYADIPVVKSKEEYSRGRWQFDAHGFARSSGDRLLTPAEIVKLPWNTVFKLFRQHSADHVYAFEQDVALAEALESAKRLPPDFMLLQPVSWHPDVWTDITRMQTLNGSQARRQRTKHLCPLPLDIVRRLITQLSMPGELVFDPFSGLATVPYCAVKLRRRGLGVELNAEYFADGVAYCGEAEREASAPTLFDLLEEEGAA